MNTISDMTGAQILDVAMAMEDNIARIYYKIQKNGEIHYIKMPPTGEIDLESVSKEAFQKRSDEHKFLVMITTEGGDTDDHQDACDFAEMRAEIWLGRHCNGGQGHYFTNGVAITRKEILNNPFLRTVYNHPA